MENLGVFFWLGKGTIVWVFDIWFSRGELGLNIIIIVVVVVTTVIMEGELVEGERRIGGDCKKKS